MMICRVVYTIYLFIDNNDDHWSRTYLLNTMYLLAQFENIFMKMFTGIIDNVKFIGQANYIFCQKNYIRESMVTIVEEGHNDHKIR